MGYHSRNSDSTLKFKNTKKLRRGGTTIFWTNYHFRQHFNHHYTLPESSSQNTEHSADNIVTVPDYGTCTVEAISKLHNK